MVRTLHKLFNLRFSRRHLGLGKLEKAFDVECLGHVKDAFLSVFGQEFHFDTVLVTHSVEALGTSC